jgi:hypothetical protein
MLGPQGPGCPGVQRLHPAAWGGGTVRRWGSRGSFGHGRLRFLRGGGVPAPLKMLILLLSDGQKGFSFRKNMRLPRRCRMGSGKGVRFRRIQDGPDGFMEIHRGLVEGALLILGPSRGVEAL